MPNPLLGGPEMFYHGFLPLDKLQRMPTKADEPLSIRFNFGGLLLDQLPSNANDLHPTDYFLIVGTRLMRIRACPHVRGSILCIFRAIVVLRYQATVTPEILDPSYHALSGGTAGVVDSVYAMYWQ